MGFPSLKKPPVGPSFSNAAAQTIPRAPLLLNGVQIAPPMSVRTHPGHTAFTFIPYSLSFSANWMVGTFNAALDAE